MNNMYGPPPPPRDSSNAVVIIVIVVAVVAFLGFIGIFVGAGVVAYFTTKRAQRDAVVQVERARSAESSALARVEAERRATKATVDLEELEAELATNRVDKTLIERVKAAQKEKDEAVRALVEAGGTPLEKRPVAPGPSGRPNVPCNCDPRDPLCGC